MRRSSFALLACLAAGCTGAPKAAERAEAKPVLPAVVQPETVEAQVDPDAESEADRKTRDALEGKVIDTVAFNGDSLEMALNYVRDATGVNMVVVWGDIETTGIKRDRAVTQPLKKVSADQLLKTILGLVAADQEDANHLDYVIDNGIVIVATQKYLRRTTLERTYAIRDLLTQPPNFADAPSFSMGGGLVGGGGGGWDGPTPGTDESTREIDQQKEAEELASRIREHVGVRSEWDDNLSIISAYRGQLLVKTTHENHRALKALLEKYRNEKFLPIALQARVMRMSSAELEKISAQTKGALELDAIGVRALMAHAAEKDSGIQVLSTGRYQCISGQRTYAMASAQKSFVSDVGPAVSGASMTIKETKTTKQTKDGAEITESKETNDPKEVKSSDMPRVTISTIQHGFACDLEATASGDHRQVISTVRCSWAMPGEMRLTPPVGGIQAEAPEMALLQWRTTTPIPNGGAVLLTASAPAKAGENAMETVLLLQATVVEPKGK